MIIALRTLRVILAVIGLWQIIGLFPILSWAGNPKAVTLEMVAGAAFKIVIATVCAAAYYWLGRLKNKRGPRQEKIGDAGIAGIVLAAGICAIILVALVVPSGNKRVRPQSADLQSAAPEIQNPGVASAPSCDAQGWTQESTGIDIVDPYQPEPPIGTRFYRDAQGIIYHVYPPGVRPDLPSANPFGLCGSTDRP